MFAEPGLDLVDRAEHLPRNAVRIAGLFPERDELRVGTNPGLAGGRESGEGTRIEPEAFGTLELGTFVGVAASWLEAAGTAASASTAATARTRFFTDPTRRAAGRA